MKNIWKWILGIVLVVAVVAGLAGAVFVTHKMMAAHMANRQVRAAQGATPGPQSGKSPEKGSMENRFPGWHEPGRRPMGGHGAGFGRFHHGASRFHGGMHGPGFKMLGGLMRLVPLALLALLLVGAYKLGKRATVISAAAVAPAPSHACPKCGNSVQDDWKHCPNCGKKQ